MLIGLAAAGMMVAASGCAAEPQTQNEAPTTLKSFVTTDGIRLHYIDHGGSGPALVFLPGMGNTAHIYDDLAPRFTDRFHVLALTRRGHGQSDKPETGYDTDTLVADLAGFLDALEIRRASLVGHSIAGGELTRFAGLHPERVDRLIYLDAAYDWERLPEMIENDPAGEPQPGPADIESFAAFNDWYRRTMGFWSPALQTDLEAMYRARDGGLSPTTPRTASAALYEGMVAFRPDYAAVRAPALGIYAIQAQPNLPDDAEAALRATAQAFVDNVYAPWQRSEAERFDREAGCSQAVMMDGAHHYVFIDRQDAVATLMRDFLLSDEPCERAGEAP